LLTSKKRDTHPREISPKKTKKGGKSRGQRKGPELGIKRDAESLLVWLRGREAYNQMIKKRKGQ